MCLLCFQRQGWYTHCSFRDNKNKKQPCSNNCDVLTGGYVVYFGFKGERFSCSKDHFLLDKDPMWCLNKNCGNKCMDRHDFMDITDMLPYDTPFQTFVPMCSEACRKKVRTTLASNTPCCICMDITVTVTRCESCQISSYCSTDCAFKGCAMDDMFLCRSIMKTRIAVFKSCEVCNAYDCKHQCAGCKSIYYCSPQCQQKNWNAHKPFCMPVPQ